jgi:hypothetical protein
MAWQKSAFMRLQTFSCASIELMDMLKKAQIGAFFMLAKKRLEFLCLARAARLAPQALAWQPPCRMFYSP